MPQKTFLAIIWISFLLLTGCAGTVTERRVVVDGEQAYQERLVAAKAKPTKADFTALRLAYAQTAAYNPYLGPEQGRNTTLFAALQGAQFDQAVEMAQQLLASNYVSLDGHYVAWQGYEASGNANRALHHRVFLNALLESISASGDGITTETAYRVISSQEMYAFLGLHGLEPRSQALLRAGHTTYNRVTVIDNDGNRRDVYFDITLQVERGFSPNSD